MSFCCVRKEITRQRLQLGVYLMAVVSWKFNLVITFPFIIYLP